MTVVFVGGVVVGTYQWQPVAELQADDDSRPNDGGTESTPTRQPVAVPYELPTYRQSYFRRDEQGTLELQRDLPVRSENTYRFQRTIQPGKTAIIVMDPWIDMPAEQLNLYYGQIAKTRVLPLVEAAIGRGHPIIIFTNDPAVVDYDTKIHPELAALSDKGMATTLHHQDFDDDSFAEHLRAKGIDTLIYTGFASNMCVIGRRTGMIPMVHHGFRLFFVPEASAAVEYPDTWENQAIHHATTKIIAQWIAEIVDYDAFMQATIAR